MRGRIRADDGFFFLMALLLLTLPLRWVLACFLAAMVHELGHALAVLLCGGRITGVMLSFRGARMDAAPLPVGAELVCVLAGPAVSLTLGLLLPWFPRLALCGFVQGVYNLLPLGRLDGARAVACLHSLWRNGVSHPEKELANSPNQ